MLTFHVIKVFIDVSVFVCSHQQFCCLVYIQIFCCMVDGCATV